MTDSTVKVRIFNFEYLKLLVEAAHSRDLPADTLRSLGA
jgi:hypothetical protein